MELSGGTGAHETVKINQSQHIYIEGADIHGADDNAIHFVVVQYGHVIDSEIHDAVDWCMYTKGGSVYLTIAGNDVHDCGTGGIVAGQGTGFEFMTAPWLHYEAYGVQIVDNVYHSVDGVGLGVNGGYGILLAHNTLYRTGARSHVAEFVLGRRGRDGTTERCQANHDVGGWGSTGGEEQYIPNRHAWFYDNLILNPDGAGSQWQQFQIGGPVDPPAESGVPSPALADDDLRIIGNVVWNGPADHPLGTGDGGCPDDHPTCSAAEITADNTINTVQPELADPEAGDYRLTDASRTCAARTGRHPRPRSGPARRVEHPRRPDVTRARDRPDRRRRQQLSRRRFVRTVLDASCARCSPGALRAHDPPCIVRIVRRQCASCARSALGGVGRETVTAVAAAAGGGRVVSRRWCCRRRGAWGGRCATGRPNRGGQRPPQERSGRGRSRRRP